MKYDIDFFLRGKLDDKLVLARRLKKVLVASQHAENSKFKEMWLKKFDQLILEDE
jgi:hypothetical protein